MKKIFMAVAFLSFCHSNAQVSFKPGIKAGYAAATISDFDADYRNGFYAGAFGALKLSRFYTMQFELMYLQQGVSNYSWTDVDYTNNNSNVYRKGDIHLNYVSFNLINKFSFDKFNLFVGPGLDVNISDDKGEFYDDYNNGFPSTLKYSKTSDIDLTLNIGLGYNITENLSVEARMRQGLLEQISPNDRYDYSFNSHLNRSFLVGLAYTFK